MNFETYKKDAASWLYKKFVSAYKTSYCDDVLPDNLRPKTLYILSDGGYEEQAAMICPCGCGETLHLNLMPDERPLWRIIKHKNQTVSLMPSIWRKVGCKSHYWFWEGRIYWAENRSFIQDWIASTFLGNLNAFDNHDQTSSRKSDM
ncbi:MAG: hypothetical protein KDD35_03105 [Bdellovibrionales bacterium]|nr:hypothetical protein [Bdellovibrionales bacterium]